MRPDTRKKLRAGYPLILLFAVLAAGIIATGYLSYRNYERRFRIETERQLSAIAELKVNELVRWRKERLGDAGILFKNASFSALVRNFFRRPADSESRGQLQVWLDNYRTHYEYDRIFLLDAQCVERISAPETPEPVAAHLLEQAPKILRSDRVTFLDFHRDSPDRPIHLSVLVPILDGGSDRPALGILVLRIDPGKYLYPYISRWPAPSRSAETLLVRRDGNDALYLNELKFQKNTALNLRVPLTAIDVPAVKAALGREGIAEGVDYRGVRVAACVRAVPDSPWFLVDCMDTAEVYAPARERLWVTVGLVGALFLGAGAGVGLIWRHQRARFYRELYRTAEARRESEDKHRTLFETMAQGVVYQNAEGHIITANPAAERILGLTLDEMLGRKSTDPRWRAIHEDGSDFPGDTHPAMVALRTGKDVRNVIMGVFHPCDNEYVWININAMSQFKPDNTKPHQVYTTFEDITERKRAEDALRRAEENFRRSLDDSPLGVRIVNAEGETLYANRAILDIYGYDSIEELRATPLGDRYTPESYGEFQLRKEKRLQGEVGPPEYQISIVKKNGEIRRLQVFRKEVFWNGTRRFQTLYHDVTEQKRAEEAVQAALREKEVLLREIHHRVKNNMQVISSLFNLQAGHIKDEEARRILKEGQTRIRSMGLIHEKLYQSRDLSKIDFSAYIRSLSVHLFHAYRIDANQVRLETELEDVHLDINAAVPCGLLVNELISNALKHAFPEGRKGVVKIGLRRREDGAVELRVADDGVGFPEKLDFRRTESLGLQIVNLLIGQLDGSIELERKRGTAIVIAFQETGSKPKTP